MENLRKRKILSIIIYTIVFVCATFIACTGIFEGAGDGQVGDYVIGLGYFKPFTMDSNILAGIASLIMLIFTTRELITGKKTPLWASILHFTATACLFLTFLIAAAFLGPMMAMGGKSYFVMFTNDMFFFHFLNPVLSIIAFTIINKDYHFSKKMTLIGIIPTVIYSIVYLLMVVIFKKWNDFYNFTFGGRYQFVPLVIIVIYAIVTILCYILTAIHNKG